VQRAGAFRGARSRKLDGRDRNSPLRLCGKTRGTSPVGIPRCLAAVRAEARNGSSAPSRTRPRLAASLANEVRITSPDEVTLAERSEPASSSRRVRGAHHRSPEGQASLSAGVGLLNGGRRLRPGRLVGQRPRLPVCFRVRQDFVVAVDRLLVIAASPAVVRFQRRVDPDDGLDREGLGWLGHVVGVRAIVAGGMSGVMRRLNGRSQ
jgi:hypothetical protein